MSTIQRRNQLTGQNHIADQSMPIDAHMAEDSNTNIKHEVSQLTNARDSERQSIKQQNTTVKEEIEVSKSRVNESDGEAQAPE